jgi:hypothetical protein
MPDLALHLFVFVLSGAGISLIDTGIMGDAADCEIQRAKFMEIAKSHDFRLPDGDLVVGSICRVPGARA